MRIFVDIDGTLTDQQRRRSWWRGKRRDAVIRKVKDAYDAGHEIILWTGNTGYAQKVAVELAEEYGIHVGGAVGKPNLCIDNEKGRLQRRLRRSVITPEEFLARDMEGKT